jgi:hypothetical protein
VKTIIKDYGQTKTGFKVIQNGNLIQSFNQANQLFHYIDLSYLKDDIYFIGWVGYRTNEQIKEVLDGHFMEIYSSHKCSKMIINNSKMTGTFFTINDWLTAYLMPKMINMGLLYNAVIYPENIFAQLAVEDFGQKKEGFKNRSFKNLDSALTWLKGEY